MHQEPSALPIVAIDDAVLMKVEVPADERPPRVEVRDCPFDGGLAHLVPWPLAREFAPETLPAEAGACVTLNHRLPVEVCDAGWQRGDLALRAQAGVPGVAGQAHDGVAGQRLAEELEDALKRGGGAGPVRGEPKPGDFVCHQDECRGLRPEARGRYPGRPQSRHP